MQIYKVANHEDSYLPDGLKFKLCWSDEFDKDKLDETKWSFRRHLFHNKHKAWIGEEGVEFKDSNIIFKLIEKDGVFYSSQIQTGENWYDRPCDNRDWCIAKFSEPKFLHKQGYYEARVKLQKSTAWWSAFWIQSPNIGTHPDEKIAGVEVDIMESFNGNNTYIPHCIHWGGYNENHHGAITHGIEDRVVDILTDSMPLDEGYHRFGCLWDEEGYTFFIDGKQSSEKLTGAVSFADQFVLLGTEPMGHRGDPVHNIQIKKAFENKDYIGDTFMCDYVRVFDIVK